MPIAAIPLFIITAGHYTLPYFYRSRRRKKRYSSTFRSRSSTAGPTVGCTQARYQSFLRRRRRVIIFKGEDYRAHLRKYANLRRHKKKTRNNSSDPEGGHSSSQESPSLLLYQSFLIDCLHFWKTQVQHSLKDLLGRLGSCALFSVRSHIE